ncbi:hypothetical protein FGO68_gene3652 [Halteria grandinella]|uniref:Uncharacterized protein n=1 Tax=Halteria grandinella TaxID=5974 RepID=A0A8J8NWL1_HALGN|nr:hypothetical protein FGO68_gene3652 [Halteria grandinella]
MSSSLRGIQNQISREHRTSLYCHSLTISESSSTRARLQISQRPQISKHSMIASESFLRSRLPKLTGL